MNNNQKSTPRALDMLYLNSVPNKEFPSEFHNSMYNIIFSRSTSADAFLLDSSCTWDLPSTSYLARDVGSERQQYASATSIPHEQT